MYVALPKKKWSSRRSPTIPINTLMIQIENTNLWDGMGRKKLPGGNPCFLIEKQLWFCSPIGSQLSQLRSQLCPTKKKQKCRTNPICLFERVLAIRRRDYHPGIKHALLENGLVIFLARNLLRLHGIFHYKWRFLARKITELNSASSSQPCWNQSIDPLKSHEATIFLSFSYGFPMFPPCVRILPSLMARSLQPLGKSRRHRQLHRRSRSFRRDVAWQSAAVAFVGLHVG